MLLYHLVTYGDVLLSFFQVHLLVIFRLIFQTLDQVPTIPQSVLCMHEGLVYSGSGPHSQYLRPLCFLRPHQTESARICTTVHKTTSSGPPSGVTAWLLKNTSRKTPVNTADS